LALSYAAHERQKIKMDPGFRRDDRRAATFAAMTLGLRLLLR
jgi:hypothetical protein